MARRKKRFYRCESFGASSTAKRDAEIEARLIRETGIKATVKKDALGYKVCRTYKRRR